MNQADKQHEPSTKNQFLVGAAVGSGLAALASQSGGADFLLVLNAGYLRNKGAPSISSILPVADGNKAALETGKSEILPQVHLPVYLGANVYEPAEKLDQLLDEAKWQGFVGLVNFPSAIHLPQDLQLAFENYGIGFSAELKLLNQAQKKGLKAIAYVHNKAQAVAAATAGIDRICLNFGWNIGGVSGAQTKLSMEDVTSQAKDIHQFLAKRYAHVQFFLEGGPIASAEHMAQIYQNVKVAGYIGGSTLDRLPIEQSISDRTYSFKGVEILAAEMQRREEDSIRKTKAIGLLGCSVPMRQTFEHLRILSSNGSPVMLFGEEGSGRSLAAEALHSMGTRRTAPYTELLLSQLTSHEVGVRLFGRDQYSDANSRSRLPGFLTSLDGGSLHIESVEKLPTRLQKRLGRYLQRGNFTPLDGRRVISSDVRIICSSEHSLLALAESGSLEPDLCAAFFGNEVNMPALRERPEDVPEILRAFIGKFARTEYARIKLDASALGVLGAQHWPGNISELRRLATRLAVLAGQNISAADILSSMESMAPKPSEFLDEREWIACALKRNRYRRIETAKELNLSRKTLYNKIKKYGLE